MFYIDTQKNNLVKKKHPEAKKKTTINPTKQLMQLQLKKKGNNTRFKFDVVFFL